MPVTLPLEVYESLERGLGKEDAKKVVHGLEATISEATEYKWATKDEIISEFRKEIDRLRGEVKSEIGGIRDEIDSLRKEFVTKELFEERMNALRAEMIGIKAGLEGKIENVRLEMHGIKADLEGRIENVKADLEGKIENVRVDLEGKIEKEVIKLDRKITIMFIVLFFTIIFLNQNALEFLAKILGLVK